MAEAPARWTPRSGAATQWSPAAASQEAWSLAPDAAGTWPLTPRALSVGDPGFLLLEDCRRLTLEDAP